MPLLYLASVVAVQAVDPLEPPAGPTEAGSALYDLSALYNRLDSGAAGAKRGATFAEPASGPGDTLYSLDEIMSKMPVVDDTNGAAVGNVVAGKTFWGLTSAGWGLQTGTLAAQTPTADSVNQAAGVYEAFDLSAVDTDLAAGNIKSGVSIFGVSGDSNVVDTSSGDAVASDLLKDKVAFVDGSMVTGSMETRTLSAANGTVSAGYYAATTLSAVDSDLAAGNIKTGVTLFGVTGSYTGQTLSGNAGVADVLQFKTFCNSTKCGNIGTMPDVTTSQASSAQAAGTETIELTAPVGYYDGSDKVTATDAEVAALDTDLTAGNIKSGTDIFGVTGTYPLAAVGKTGQTTSYATGDDGDLEKGAAPSGDRFTDNGNGTVTDNLTGLIWLKNANCANATRDWATALSDVASLNSDGTMNTNGCGDTSNSGSHQTDWRLPNIKELQSLIDFAYYVPALSDTAGTGQWTEGSPFSGVQTVYYWSSSTVASNTFYAWVLHLNDGLVGYDDKTVTRYVWPVRGGQ